MRRFLTMNKPGDLSHQRPARTGAVLIVALASLLIIVTMIAAMLKGALRDRRQLHIERDLRQTELLLQAGVERARLRITRDEEYEGETWMIPAEELRGHASGRVGIEVTRPSPDDPWRVRVEAEYPAGSDRSIRRSRTLQIPLT